MSRDHTFKVSLDAFAAARLTLRAEEAGTTVSAYVADLIAQDADKGLAHALAAEQLEIQIFTAILVLTVLAGARGEPEVRRLAEGAKERATEHARAVLADLRASGPRG
jgi:riboflavin synthase